MVHVRKFIVINAVAAHDEMCKMMFNGRVWRRYLIVRFWNL